MLEAKENRREGETGRASKTTVVNKPLLRVVHICDIAHSMEARVVH